MNDPIKKFHRLYEYPHADHPGIEEYREGFDECYVALDETRDALVLAQARIEKLEAQDGENVGEYVARQIDDIFMRVSEGVADGTWELEHPAPIIRASFAMTNAWSNFLAALEAD